LAYCGTDYVPVRVLYFELCSVSSVHDPMNQLQRDASYV